MTSFSFATADALAMPRRKSADFLQYSRVTANTTGVISHATDHPM